MHSSHDTASRGPVGAWSPSGRPTLAGCSLGQAFLMSGSWSQLFLRRLLLSYFLISYYQFIVSFSWRLELEAWSLRLVACGFLFFNSRSHILTYEGGRSSSACVRYLNKDIVLILISWLSSSWLRPASRYYLLETFQIIVYQFARSF